MDQQLEKWVDPRTKGVEAEVVERSNTHDNLVQLLPVVWWTAFKNIPLRKTKEPATFVSMPQEVLDKIFNFSSTTSSTCLGLTCKRFYATHFRIHGAVTFASLAITKETNGSKDAITDVDLHHLLKDWMWQGARLVWDGEFGQCFVDETDKELLATMVQDRKRYWKARMKTIDKKMKKAWVKLINDQITERQYRDRVWYLKWEHKKSHDAFTDGNPGAITSPYVDIWQRLHAARYIRKEIAKLEKEVRAEHAMGIVWTPSQHATSNNLEDAVEQKIPPGMSAAEKLWRFRNKYEKCSEVWIGPILPTEDHSYGVRCR